MAIFYIDNDTTALLYEQIVFLDGREYIMRFKWNPRAQGWFMDVNDQDSNPIVNGVRLVCGVPLAREVVGDSRMWPGTLLCISTTQDDSDPGVADLGGRCVLFYDDGQAIAS